MIRFLNLKDQIIEGEPSFAFLNTIPDKIIEFDGEQIFYNIKEFIEAWNQAEEIDKTIMPIERFTEQIPTMYFYTNNLPDAK